MSLLRRAPSIVTVANEKVSIVIACRMAGVDLPDDPGYGRSMKVRCPFGEIYHSDGGKDLALRVYVDSNSAWCFACTAFYTPVKMVAQARDLDWATAATVLLDHIGYKPVSLADQWQALLDEVPVPDTAQLADALKTYCERVIPSWAVRQFDTAEAALLTRCLALLDRVACREDADRWLATTKQVMSREFGASHSCTLRNSFEYSGPH